MLKKKSVTKLALSLSSLLIAFWVLLGANASLAWFQDEDVIVNSLNFGDLKVKLYYKDSGEYLPVDGETRVFDNAALYEPGYTQIVYLRIENSGTIDFTYDMSVIPDLKSVRTGINEKGEEIYLPDYLYFGFMFAETEDALFEKTAKRDLARVCATHKLSNYSEEGGIIAPGESNYCALVLYMPEEVANEANYRGDVPPSVEVGIGVVANQLK